MNQKRIWSLVIAGIMLISLTTVVMPKVKAGFHSVKGGLYIDGVVAPIGVRIDIVFPGSPSVTYNGTTFEMDPMGFNYNIGFTGHENETGYFNIFYLNLLTI